MSSALVQIVDRAVAEALALAGDQIVCRKGCTHCCIGPFAVTVLDLERLRMGIEELSSEDRERLRQRSMEAREVMREGFPGDWTTGIVEELDEADRFDVRHPWLPCPVLDLEAGACSLHQWRPVACRLHGPALLMNGLRIQHCRLNYADVPASNYAVSFETPDCSEVSPLSYIAWAATS